MGMEVEFPLDEKLLHCVKGMGIGTEKQASALDGTKCPECATGWEPSYMES